LISGQACRRLKQAIDHSISCQYTIALGAAGQIDVSTSSAKWTTARKLDAVRRHELAWRNLSFSERHTLKVSIRNSWELYGGVLGCELAEKSFRFIQLPSVLRGIEMKEWGFKTVFPVRDFSFEPSMDLAVFIEDVLRYVSRDVVL